MPAQHEDENKEKSIDQQKRQAEIPPGLGSSSKDKSDLSNPTRAPAIPTSENVEKREPVYQTKPDDTSASKQHLQPAIDFDFDALLAPYQNGQSQLINPTLSAKIVDTTSQVSPDIDNVKKSSDGDTMERRPDQQLPSPLEHQPTANTVPQKTISANHQPTVDNIPQETISANHQPTVNNIPQETISAQCQSVVDTVPQNTVSASQGHSKQYTITDHPADATNISSKSPSHTGLKRKASDAVKVDDRKPKKTTTDRAKTGIVGIPDRTSGTGHTTPVANNVPPKDLLYVAQQGKVPCFYPFLKRSQRDCNGTMY